MMKKESGITLVALVVTIVILIILAVISINIVFGENGLIHKAQEAEEIQRQAEMNTMSDLNTLMSKIEEMIGQQTGSGEEGEITPELNGQKSEDWIYDEATKTITGYKGADLLTMTEVTIPNTIIVNGEKKPVEIIKGGYYTNSSNNVNDKISSIFNSYRAEYKDDTHVNRNIKKINVSKGIKEIGDNALKELYALEEINLPEGLEIIGKNAFMIAFYEKKASLTTVFPHSLRIVKSGAFNGNVLAKDIRFSEKIELIDTSAFGYITIADGVGFYINEEDKPGCNVKLTDIHGDFAPSYNNIVVKGDRVTNDGTDFATYSMGPSAKTAYFKGLDKISESFFSGNKDIEQIVFENSSTTQLTEIGRYAFSDCSKLNNFVIPASVVTIGFDAFNGYASDVIGDKVINCEVSTKPSGWDTNWVSSDVDNRNGINVVWGYRK